MASLGMFCLGAFIGWIVSYGLVQVKDWSNPGNVFSAVISAAVAGGVFNFIEHLSGDKIGEAIFFYPVGLAYGALLNSFFWFPNKDPREIKIYQRMHVGAVAFASVSIVAIIFISELQALLP